MPFTGDWIWAWLSPLETLVFMLEMTCHQLSQEDDKIMVLPCVVMQDETDSLSVLSM